MTQSKPLCELSDEEVVFLAQEGNSGALEHIIVRYRNFVYKKAKQFFLIGSDEDDLIQEGMIGLYAAIKSYRADKGAKFATYANHCIDNSVQSALRKFTRKKDIPQSSIVPLDQSLFESKVGLSAEDEYLAQESVNILADVIYEELSTFENEVLRLYLVGCSYNEIADKLGKTPKAVDNAIQRIRKKLNGVTF